MRVLIDLLAERIESDGKQDGRSDVLREVHLSRNDSISLSVSLHFEAVPRDDVSNGDTDLRAVDCSFCGHSDGDFGVLVCTCEWSVDGEQGVAG